MDIKKLYGSIVALVTPFDENGAIDLSAFDRLIDFHLQNGTSSILLAGTTGEGPTITNDELKTMLSRARSIAGDQYPLIVGTGTNSTFSTIQRTKIAEDSGADFALIVGPYYNKPTQEGFYRHYQAVSEAVDIPLIIYNVPGRTGSNILPETVIRLFEIPNIVGIKEASGDLKQIQNLFDIKSQNEFVLSGDDALTLSIIGMGGVGLISVVANEMPADMSDMVKYALVGELESARNLHEKMLPMMEANFTESNPIPVKYALYKMGLISETYRLPMVSLEKQNKDKMDDILNSFGLIKSDD
ncbi:4-hydroxy-tetrahydrodipicolinate synthase [Candidatus Marinimicrobia bacterium MT.SAG.3]|nr:4-hydroxy-tetrahydrodipicolinate synthase [Candidatus Marinimicrobia bacterium MT.SAG.3]